VTLDPSVNDANGGEDVAEFATLRKLLVGPEQNRLDELSRELQARELTADELADQLPEAIALSGSRDDQLGRALGPTIETALRESIRRDPQEVASAIFPVLGPAIRKAIAETMSSLVRSINRAVEQSFSLNGIKWRIEAWRTGIPYAEIVIKHALLYRVEQAFLIHAETGLLLQHVSLPDLSVPDADLISSMLSAIQDFVRDSFRPAEGGMLRTFSVGDHTVRVEAGPRALLALVIRGESPDEVLRNQQDALETIHLEFATQLAEFSGDATPFSAARPLLESCLETVLTTTESSTKGRAWLRWALPLLLVVIVIAFLWVRSTMRWNRALTALRAEPGYVVVDASRGFRQWNISGLKDPSARQPSAVLSGSGIVPPNLSGRWTPYLSLDPILIAARARQSLELGQSALVAMRGDTLAVSGDIPLASLRRASVAPLPAGVAKLDLHGATPFLPAGLDSLQRSIETERVLFDAGSADISQPARARLQGLAALVNRLDGEIANLGGVMRLELTGRTDPTGLDALNQSLARRRVQTVGDVLSAFGVPIAHLSLNPIATARPLSSPDPREQARINRSVSFNVAVSVPPLRQEGGR
jgi:outer membrane protein OmpA-like peptidoglycan-associated protein